MINAETQQDPQAYVLRKFAELEAARPEAPSFSTLSPNNFYKVRTE